MSQYNNSSQNAMHRFHQYKSEEIYRGYNGRKALLDCECSCLQCLKPKPCCNLLCEYCPKSSLQTYLIYPYPVPIIITELSTTDTPNTTAVSTTTNRPTSSLSITMSTAPYHVNPEEETTVKNKKLKLNLQCQQERRCIKRTKATSVNRNIFNTVPVIKNTDKKNVGQSKSGEDYNEVIPLPNDVAYDLISKLRKAKDFQVL